MILSLNVNYLIYFKINWDRCRFRKWSYKFFEVHLIMINWGHIKFSQKKNIFHIFIINFYQFLLLKKIINKNSLRIYFIFIFLGKLAFENHLSKLTDIKFVRIDILRTNWFLFQWKIKSNTLTNCLKLKKISFEMNGVKCFYKNRGLV